MDSLKVLTSLFTDSVGLSLFDLFRTRSQAAEKEKQEYTHKLEYAQGEDIFKYLLLINTSALDGYVAQTRLQAQQSFRLCKRVALGGFLLLAIGVTLSIFSTSSGSNLNPAYLSAISGVLVVFISGVFFYFHSRTLQKIDHFHDRLVSSQHISMSFLAADLASDSGDAKQLKGELARSLMATIGEHDQADEGQIPRQASI